jgi:hypothetical protein
VNPNVVCLNRNFTEFPINPGKTFGNKEKTGPERPDRFFSRISERP